VALSPAADNGKSGRPLLCPGMQQAKGYPLERLMRSRLGVGGVILTDQIKSLDMQTRGAELACQSPAGTIWDVLRKLNSCSPSLALGAVLGGGSTGGLARRSASKELQGACGIHLSNVSYAQPARAVRSMQPGRYLTDTVNQWQSDRWT